jgi:hypothetical protein
MGADQKEAAANFANQHESKAGIGFACFALIRGSIFFYQRRSAAKSFLFFNTCK